MADSLFALTSNRVATPFRLALNFHPTPMLPTAPSSYTLATATIRRRLLKMLAPATFTVLLASATGAGQALVLQDTEILSRPGFDVLVFNNWYDGNFSDAKIAGIELIHHDVRTATNGDVRLSPTPAQWDPAPTLVSRNVLTDENAIEVKLSYPDYHFEYAIRAESSGDGVLLSVILNKPLPSELEGKAGFNFEFLPSAYFTKSYFMDDRTAVFPRYPSGPTGRGEAGEVTRLPIATGSKLVLAPEDPARRVTVESRSGKIALYDGRNEAQNGWFVVRSKLPANKTGPVVEWFVTGNSLPGWKRKPVIAHSQVGYHPKQAKVALIECDGKADAPELVRLIRVMPDGRQVERLAARPALWGNYLRYKYYEFDFSEVRETGLYLLEGAGVKTAAFKIGTDAYADLWHTTLDVFFPVQMDHMLVNEAYRVWHGASHLDDARQAPVDHEHFDLYAQGPTTDTPFKPGEHIPGLNIGGWYDAGDYDIRTQTQYAVVLNMVHTWETFRPERDETSVDYLMRRVEIHQPDGVPDLLQQIEHGTLALIAQHRAVGHAIPGIIAPDLGQYTHLGDGSTKTDNRIFNSSMAPHESNGIHSGIPDDRWAFTSKSSALNYGSASALAAASRALRGYRDDLADECLQTAEKVWTEEHSHEPHTFRHGNTTGGRLEGEEFKAAAELLITTGDKRYSERINELWPAISEAFSFNAQTALRVLPYMDEDFKAAVHASALEFRDRPFPYGRENPFGVPITERGWAGNGTVVATALTNYHLHMAFPEDFGPDRTLNGLEYIFGRHPGSDISFVSAVGAYSKTVAYGSNRADFSFIAGGVVPGVLVLKPDFPENKEDWPFFWGENEYVVNLASSYMFLVQAADRLLNQEAVNANRDDGSEN